MFLQSSTISANNFFSFWFTLCSIKALLVNSFHSLIVIFHYLHADCRRLCVSRQVTDTVIKQLPAIVWRHSTTGSGRWVKNHQVWSVHGSKFLIHFNHCVIWLQNFSSCIQPLGFVPLQTIQSLQCSHHSLYSNKSTRFNESLRKCACQHTRWLAFRKVPSPNAYTSLFTRFEFYNPTQISNHHYRMKGYSYEFWFGWYTQTVHVNKSPLRITKKRDCGLWRYPGTAHFLWVPPSMWGQGWSSELQTLHAHSQDQTEQRNKRPLKFRDQ